METLEVSDSPPSETADASQTPARHGWSDRTADTVGILVILAALVLAALHFISGGLTS